MYVTYTEDEVGLFLRFFINEAICRNLQYCRLYMQITDIRCSRVGEMQRTRELAT